MSWKYSMPSSYTTRDLSSSRDSSSQKFGTSPLTSKFATERQSRWSACNGSTPSEPPATRTYTRMSAPQPEQTIPIRAKTTVSENPSSVVQRLKERYASTNSLVPSASADAPTKTAITHRPYGRSVTSLSLGNNYATPKTSYDAESRRDYGSGRSLISEGKLNLKLDGNAGEKTTGTTYKTSDSTYSPKSPSHATSRFLPSSKNLPTSPTSSGEKKLTNGVANHQQHQEESDGEWVTVVARGTSPSQTTSSIYLRTRRADFGIEKKIHRPKIKPPFSHKETQTDKQEESHISKYAYGDINSRIKPWSSYGSTYNSTRFSSRSSFKSEPAKEVSSPTRGGLSPGTTTTCGRPLSRESSSLEPKSPESPTVTSAKPPTSFRSMETLKLQKPVSPNKESEMKPAVAPLRKAPSVTKCEMVRPPTTTTMKMNKPPEPCAAPAVNGNGLIDDSSSMSESDEDDETSSSDEEMERIKKSETSFVKKSITNFLQNIPQPRKQPSAADLVSRSKSGVLHKLNGHLGPPPKITFNRVESGERAWWMDNSEPVPEGIVKIVSGCCLAPKQPSEQSLDQGNGVGATTAATATSPECREGDVSRNHSDNRLIPRSGSSNRSLSNANGFDLNTNTFNNNRLSTYLINRQFTTDLDWLKDGEDEEGEGEEKSSSESGQKWSLDRNNNNLAVLAKRVVVEEEDAGPGTGVMGKTELTLGVDCDSTSSRGSGEGSGLGRHVQIGLVNGVSTENDNACNTRSRDNFNIMRNACANIDKSLLNSVNEVTSLLLLGDDSEEATIDVTPGLRRRREQTRGKSPEHCSPQAEREIKFGQTGADPPEPDASDMKERTASQNGIPLHQQNGVASPIDDIGDMSGLISKAKAGLVKSKTKQDVRKSSSREMSPKHEIDLYWKELVDSINRPLKLCDLDFTDLNTDDEVDILGQRREEGEIPPPPPMLILPPPGARMDGATKVPVPPATMNGGPGLVNGPTAVMVANRAASKAAPAPPPMIQTVKNKKTVKLFWKEVKEDALPPVKATGGPLIWDEMAKVSVDTQKLEHLFESRAKDLMTKKQHEQNKSKEIIVLDHKRSNAINIGMTKLPPPRAIKTAILKMDSTVVNKEGIEKLLTMLPTEEEKVRIQDAQSSNPDLPLGSAEQFLLILASINELEARLKLWAFKLDFENCEKEICEPLMDLKQGMEILRTNKTFRAILSTLLSIGNFLNGCDVKGFQIDYLSKVPEVKDTVQKHSLLHHLCAIVMEKFPESTDLYSEIGAVTRASKVDFDELTGNIKKIEEECKLSWSYLKMIAKHEGHTAMKVKMSDFLADCAERIIVLGIVHKRIMSRFRKFIFWLGIPLNMISITRPNEIFKVISEFALEYRTTRERILQQLKKMNHREKSRSRGYLLGDATDGSRKMNSKEAKDDARLRQLLSGDSTYAENMHNTTTWRRHRKDTRNLIDLTNNNGSNNNNNDDDEIIETLIKTANQIPSHRPSVRQDRRRTNRVIERKS